MSGTDPTENRQHDQAGPVLAALPEDWERALAVVAHPDDLEYGASAAVARWTAMGKDVRYVLATRGEAGIDSMPPSEAGPLRSTEQVSAAAAVGVSVGAAVGVGTSSQDASRSAATAAIAMAIWPLVCRMWSPSGAYG